MADEVREHPNRWQTVVIGILAHEWGHAFQYRSALDEKLFLWETHADFLAGWYLGIKRVYGYQVEPELFSLALRSRGSSLGYFSENAYGSPQQRSDAMEGGFEFALRNVRADKRPLSSDAAEAGYDFVSRMRSQTGRAQKL